MAAGSWVRTTLTPWAWRLTWPAACVQLGELQAARDLAADTLDRCRRVLGEDHPTTLVSANNLVAVLRDLGELQAARDLAEDNLDRGRRVLGEDHPEVFTPRLTWPVSCVNWASCRQPVTWLRTPWTVATVSWVKTTPTPWAWRLTWPVSCVRWASWRPPVTWPRTPWNAAAESWAKTIPPP